MYNDGRDFGEMHASCEKDFAHYRVAAGADLRQAVQVTTVMAHAPAYRDLLKTGSLGKS